MDRTVSVLPDTPSTETATVSLATPPAPRATGRATTTVFRASTPIRSSMQECADATAVSTLLQTTSARSAIRTA